MVNDITLLLNYYRRYVKHVATLRHTHSDIVQGFSYTYYVITICVYIVPCVMGSCILRAIETKEERDKDREYFKRFQHYDTAFVRGFNDHIRGIKIPRMIPHIRLFSKREKSQVSRLATYL